jgi:elongator complex protein 4
MSFKRNSSKSQTGAGAAAGTPSERISGIKPWINSQYFVSYGLRQLDELLGGGNALGTVCVIEDDHLSNHASVLFNYSIAEGISHNHQVMLVVEDSETACEIINQLPCNLNYVGGTAPVSGSTFPGAPVEELTHDWVRKLNLKWVGGADSIKDNEPQPNSSYADIAATGVVYCNSFDLSRRLQRPLLDEHAGSMCVVCAHEGVTARTRTLAEVSTSLLGSLEAFVATNGSAGRVGRAFVPRLDLLLNSCVDATSGSSGVEAARLLLAMKQLVAGSRVSLMISYMPSAMPGADMAACLCDTLLCVDSFAGKEDTVPAEFKNFCGYLHVKRIQQANSIASFRSSNCKYGIKRDRRKLHIEPLHLPPEESRAMQSSNAVHGSKDGSVAVGGRPKSSYSSGMSCAPGNAGALQF